MLFDEAPMGYILLPILLVMALVSLPRHLRQRKQAKTVMMALDGFKRGTIFAGILLFVLVLCFPVAWYKFQLSPGRIISLEESIEVQRNIASDIVRMREITFFAFLIITGWFWGAYNIVRLIASKDNKRADQALDPSDTEQGVAP